MNKIKGIKNGKIILKNKIVENKLLLYKGKIIDIVDKIENLTNIEWIDAGGNYISPGFIDIHIHGIGGYDTMDGNIESLSAISKILSENGVTAFLPTTMTMHQDKILNAMKAIREYMKNQKTGARVIGAHMEGPFINPIYKGAQNEKYIIPPNINIIKEYLDVIKLLTIAPEMDEGYRLIEELKQYKEIILSIGHSNATYEEAMNAINSGIKSATHIFNAMSSFQSRKPGVVGAVFKSNIFCELIADKIHVHPAIFSILGDIKGSDRLILITDAMRAACMKCGEYELGGKTVHVSENSARLNDGTLAGSVLRMNDAIRNMREHTDYELEEIINMVSLNPANLIGYGSSKGSIEIGKDADLTIFNKNLDILTTIVEGEMCYSRKA